MRVFLGISCYLDYSWNPAQSSQVKYLILQLIIVNSYFTLSIQTHQSREVFFAEIIVCPHSEFKNPLKFSFLFSSGMQVNLGKHVQFVYNTSTVRLGLASFYENESSYTELTADKGYTSKMLAQHIVNDCMSASKKMSEKIAILRKNWASRRSSSWNHLKPSVQASTHDNIHGTSVLGLPRFGPVELF